ncbi:S-layer homology domain-containing protein [Paenibacillus sp. YYML68]|uniref:S-layer homology domain-containing protein n=1 Tax=Paenibacillus sp. YYML68 TaxID=2909250 RepID=UPI0024900F3B|nr:S-layer homology domain-containing protein [Paenibacillus sp. YYML68]
MGRWRNTGWLKLMLAVVLLFGSLAPAAFAETMNINGITATVENETGTALQYGYLRLYERYHTETSLTDVGYNYVSSRPVYSKELDATGKFFIPNAYVLSGKTYDLTVEGYSFPGSKRIIYQYSFTGGEISELKFGKEQLKKLTFQTNIPYDDGYLTITPTSTEENFYPMTHHFNVTDGLEIYVAGNRDLGVSAVLNQTEALTSYVLTTTVPVNSPSEQTLSFGSDLVKVTAPQGSYDDIHMHFYGKNYWASNLKRTVYVSKGIEARVGFTVTKDDYIYRYDRLNAVLNEDLALQLEREMTASQVYHYWDVKDYSSSKLELIPSAYTEYSDSHGNRLWEVYPRNNTNLSTAAFMAYNEQGEVTKYELKATETGTQYSVADTASVGGGGGGSNAIPVQGMITYELLNAAGELVQVVGTNSVTRVALPNVQPGTYRLKLKEQRFPTNMVTLSADKTFTVSGEGIADFRTLPFELPAGYFFSYTQNARVYELSSGGTSRLLSSELSYESYGVPRLTIKERIAEDRKYKVYATISLRDISSNWPVTYLYAKSFDGRDLMTMDVLPVDEQVTTISFANAEIIPSERAFIQAAVPVEGLDTSKFSFRVDLGRHYAPVNAPTATLLARPGNYDFGWITLDGQGSAYELTKSVTVTPNMEPISFHELVAGTVVVKLQSEDGAEVPFKGVYVLKDQYSNTGGIGYFSPTETQVLTKVHTTPGNNRYIFRLEEKEPLETPWTYNWISERRQIETNTTLQFPSQRSEPVLEGFKVQTDEANYRTTIAASVLFQRGDLKLNEIYVNRESNVRLYAAATEARQETQAYDGDFNMTSSVPATISIKNAEGRTVYTGEDHTPSSIHITAYLTPGTYQFSYSQPVGPNQSKTLTRDFTVGKVQETPNKPVVELSMTGSGLQATWQAVLGGSYYRVFLAEKGQSLVQVADQVTDTRYVKSDVAVGKTYQVKVAAVGRTGIVTESDVAEFTVPDFSVAALDVSWPTAETGLLKLDGKVGIRLTGTYSDQYEAKAIVAYTTSAGAQTRELTLAYQQAEAKFTGEFAVEEGILSITSVEGYLVKKANAQEKSNVKKTEGVRTVGATVSGKVTYGSQIPAQAILQLYSGHRFASKAVAADGSFVLEGLAAGEAKLSLIYQGEVFSGIGPKLTIGAGQKINLKTITVPVNKTLKIQLVDAEDKPIAQSLHVSLRGKESATSAVEIYGYIGANGYFTSYTGETELKRVKTGKYELSIKGSGAFESKTQEVVIAEGTDYVVAPIMVTVDRKTKVIVPEVRIKVTIPDGFNVEELDYFRLYSPSAAQAFGYSEAVHTGYNRTMTVSERVYVPNPQHSANGGTSSTVSQNVYVRYGEFNVTNVVAAAEYELTVQEKGFRNVTGRGPIHQASTSIGAALDLGTTVTGKLMTANGRQILNAQLQAFSQTSWASTAMEANGQFTLSGLAADETIKVRIHAEGYIPVERTIGVHDAKQLGDIVLEADQFVHGRVFAADGTTPLKHAGISLYDAAGRFYKGWARTDADGYFKIRGLEAGTYRLEVSYYGYPNVSTTVEAGPTEATIVLQQETGSRFSGQGNSFSSSVATAVYGNNLEYRLNYQNNGTTTAENVRLNVELPTGVALLTGTVLLNGVPQAAVVNGSSFSVAVGSLDAGKGGHLSFEVTVSADVHTIRATGQVTAANNEQGPVMVASTSVLYASINAPATTGSKTIKVYGSAMSGSTVEIFAGDLSMGKVQVDGRWWFADITLPVADNVSEAEFQLMAKVTKNGSAGSFTSEPVTVKYAQGTPEVDSVNITAGWNKNVKLNPYTAVATMAITEMTPIEVKVVFKEAVDEAQISFLGNTYVLTKGADGKTFTGSVPSGWSSYGEQLLDLTYRLGGVTIKMPLLEVIVLIDPSGYVFEGSMDNRLEGVTAIVQQRGNNNAWSNWDADKYGQVNPQTTDDEGRYGWDVLQGDWRVLFSKEGYEGYTSRIVVVPPAETQLNVPLERTSAPSVVSITPEQGATNIEADASITIVFDRLMNQENMAPDSMRNLPGTIRVVQVSGATEVPVEGTFEFQNMKGYKEDISKTNAGLADIKGQSGWFLPDDTKLLSQEVVFKPTSALQQGAVYKMYVDAEVMDYAGKTLMQGSSASFTVKPRPADNATSYVGGGGGIIATPANGKEFTLDATKLAQLTKDKLVTVVLKNDQHTVSIANSVWKEIRAKGYTLKLEKEEAVLTVPSSAFQLQDQEVLSILFTPGEGTFGQGYKAASAALKVELAKVKDGKSVAVSSTETLELKLKAQASTEAALIGLYELKGNQWVYLGRQWTAKVTSSGTYALLTYEKAFTDVTGHWAQQDIRVLVSHHIVNGITETTFEPSGVTTRAQVAKLFAELLKLDSGSSAPSFADVATNAWYASAVAAVEKAGIFQGANGQFRPNDPISRQELAVVITRLMKKPAQAAEVTFADQASIADWAKAGVQTAVQFGIVQGDEQERFQPTSNATRAEAAAMINRLIKVLDQQ